MDRTTAESNRADSATTRESDLSMPIRLSSTYARHRHLTTADLQSYPLRARHALHDVHKS